MHKQTKTPAIQKKKQKQNKTKQKQNPETIYQL